MTKFEIPKTVPADVRAMKWPVGAPVAWSPSFHRPVVIVGITACSVPAPMTWMDTLDDDGQPLVLFQLDPLTPFCRDLLAALRVGG